MSQFDCAVKTGTAETSREKKEGNDIAWIVGFAPYEDPQVVFVVELEHSAAGGGEAAAPIAAEILHWLEECRGYSFARGGG